MKTETHHARVADQCNVLKKYKPIPALGGRVNNMRTNHKAGKLAADREQRLESAGFDWHPNDTLWEQKFEELLAFRQKHGHCNVPGKYKPNPALGGWVNNMRMMRKNSKLAADREQRLESAGIVWDQLESDWEQKFQELLAFKQTQGHCNVPAIYKPNSTLGTWVSNVRVNRKAGKLAAQREQRLEHAGFVWEALESEWEQKFQELLAFQQKHGHCQVPRGNTKAQCLSYCWEAMLHTNR